MEKVKCMYCGSLTHNTGSNLCNFCWELKWRVIDSPDFAIKMLKKDLGEDKLLKLIKEVS